MATENVSRRERLGRINWEAGEQAVYENSGKYLRAHPVSWEEATGYEQVLRASRGAEAVAAAVEQEYAPLLTIIGDIDREVWDDGVPDLSTVRRLIRAADDIRAARKES